MVYMLAVLLVAVAACLLLMMTVQAVRGTADLLSVRNFFLLGFILFQLTSPALSMWKGDYDALEVHDQPRTGAIYVSLAVAFLVLFLWGYGRRHWLRPIARRFGSDTAATGPANMLVLAAAYLVLGILCKLLLVPIPYLGTIADALGSGILVVTVAMAAWTAAPRLLNPAVVLPAGLIMMVAGIATLSGSAFSRRDLVALVIAAGWGAYHGHWKYKGGRALVLQGIPVLIAGLLLFGAFTASRSYDAPINSPGALVSRLVSASPLDGLYELGTGQYAGANSMWIIQTRPESIPYDTLHTAVYVLGHPVPRAIWPGKPGALGEVLIEQGHVRRVSRGTTVGPGLIGHIYNDNPWIAFIPYTLVLALFIGFLDELVAVRPWSPYVVLPVTVALGEIVALPRGEAGLFFVRAVVYLAGSFVLLNLTAGTLRALGFIPRAAPEEPSYEDQWGESTEEQTPPEPA